MTRRDMERLMELARKHLRGEYVDIASWLRDENTLADIEQRIRRGDYAGAVGKLDDAVKKLASEIHESYVTSGQEEAAWLDGKVPDRLVRFEALAPQVVDRARRNELELVQGFRSEQQQVARQITQRALIDGARTGINPRRIAQEFRDAIGLTPTQEQWMANYRRALERGDYAKALSYELSSGNADRSVRAAMRNEKSLTPAQIDDYVERYRQNAITYRAETIARTEALRNAHDGARDAMKQAIQRGDVDAKLLVKEWHAGPATVDSRDSHQAMDGTQVPFGQDFVFPDGTRMAGPGDPRGGAKHTANCRCTVSTSFSEAA